MYIPQLFLLLFSSHTLNIAIIPTHNPQTCLIVFAFFFKLTKNCYNSNIFFYSVSGKRQSQFRIDVSNMHLFLFNLSSCLDIRYTESWTDARKTKIQKCISKNCGGWKSKTVLEHDQDFKVDSLECFCSGWQIITTFRLHCHHDQQEIVNFLMALVTMTLIVIG